MTETVVRLHIALADTDPLIWRRVDVNRPGIVGGPNS